ncbi:MAG: hypothetical protein AAFN79_04210 [Pseudomonadota bacterium]
MFEPLCRVCGLTPATAGIYLGETRATVVKWIKEQEAPPEEHLYRIYALFDAIEHEVERVITAWEGAGKPTQISYPIAATDEKAREMGWPSIAVQKTVAAMTQATLTEVSVGFEIIE